MMSLKNLRLIYLDPLFVIKQLKVPIIALVLLIAGVSLFSNLFFTLTKPQLPLKTYSGNYISIQDYGVKFTLNDGLKKQRVFITYSKKYKHYNISTEEWDKLERKYCNDFFPMGRIEKDDGIYVPPKGGEPFFFLKQFDNFYLRFYRQPQTCGETLGKDEIINREKELFKEVNLDKFFESAMLI